MLINTTRINGAASCAAGDLHDRRMLAPNTRMQGTGLSAVEKMIFLTQDSAPQMTPFTGTRPRQAPV